MILIKHEISTLHTTMFLDHLFCVERQHAWSRVVSWLKRYDTLSIVVWS